MAETPQQDSPPSLWRLARLCGRSPLALAQEIVRLRIGPGRLSFRDYVELGLFDRAALGTADKTTFVGFHAAQRIWMLANFRVDLFGLLNHKLAADVLFAAHGFPVLQAMAIYREGVGLECPFRIAGPTGLRAFLMDNAHYPLFGKPLDGRQSLGSASLERYDPAQDRLVTTTGQRLPLIDYMAQVKAHARCGYLFQRRASPHAAIRHICGDRLATIRVLTIVTKGQPKILRACWKIPAGINTADNFWRPGNLLAQLDLDSGRVLRVMRTQGTARVELTHHPDTGAAIRGTTVPNWPQVTRLAAEAARVVPDLPLIGWDVAPVDDGAILVEPNETPDFGLHQIADRRGILDDAFRDFLAERKRDLAERSEAARQHHRGR